MKAAVYTRYGSPEVLQVKDVPKPLLSEGQVLVKVHYATVNRTDCGNRSAEYIVSRLFTGLLKPKRPIGGSEFAGEVVAVSKGVTAYKIGDRVFGFDDVQAGAHAEFVAKDANGPMAIMPKDLSYKELAAAGEGASYALNVIHAIGVNGKSKVMVYGASGAIGSAAVQLLNHLGAEVTAVCNTKNVTVVSTLKPHKVIDYQKQDFTKQTELFDFVFDAVGKSSYRICKNVLKPGGTYYSTELGKGGQNVWLALWFKLVGKKRVVFPIPKINKQTIEKVKTFVEAGAYKPLIDRTYNLTDIVEATKYVETGQKVGNVLIKIN